MRPLLLALLLQGLAGCAHTGFRAQPCEASPEAVVLDVPVVQQEARDECGLAAMRALLGYHAVPFPAEEQARMAGLAQAGPYGRGTRRGSSPDCAFRARDVAA